MRHAPSCRRSKAPGVHPGSGQVSQGTRSYLVVGGATALLLGVRQQTVDIDIKLDPEPKGVFEAIAILKNELSVNVELASPDQFLPPLPGWENRSEFIVRAGDVEFFHYDFYSQALAKLSRGHERDLSDVRAYLRLGKIRVSQLQSLFEEIIPGLARYPAIDSDTLISRVKGFCEENQNK